jgi:hypothetical protein
MERGTHPASLWGACANLALTKRGQKEKTFLEARCSFQEGGSSLQRTAAAEGAV